MKNIEILTGLAGNEFAWNVGDVIVVGADVDEAEADRWVAAGYAKATDAPRGLRVAPSEHVPNETAQADKKGVEYRGKRLFGAAAKAAQKKLDAGQA